MPGLINVALLCLTIVPLALNALPVETGSLFNTHEVNVKRYCQAPFPSASTYKPFRSPNAVLEQVHLFTRHGDRSPAGYIPRPKIEHEVEWNCDTPQLASSYVLDESHKRANVDLRVVIPNNPSLFRPYSDSVWRGSCALGQLTPKGAMQQQALGRALRKIYVDNLGFLPHKMNSSLLHSRSSNFWYAHPASTHDSTSLFFI
jgi:hypothetical protein